LFSIFKDVEVCDDKDEINVPMKSMGIVIFSNYVVESHKRLQGYMNDKHHIVNLGDWLFVLHHSLFLKRCSPWTIGVFFTKCLMESGINHNMFWFICLDVSKVFEICKE